jgi:hypothetical protein
LVSGTEGFHIRHTHVIQAPLESPNANCHAGSRDWKYSSGWKKVLTDKAFNNRNATRKAMMLQADQVSAGMGMAVFMGFILSIQFVYVYCSTVVSDVLKC